MRFTGLRPIEKGGLKGFGFSIHFDDKSNSPDGADEIPGSLPVPAAECKGGVNWTGTESETSGDSVERHAPFSHRRGTNGPSLPVETATEERTACLSRPDPSEKPGSSSGPATAAPGANPSQALGAPVEPGAVGANATAASFSGRE